jgi:hypothetical protein
MKSMTAWKGRRVTCRQKKWGESRTGPALNPLKGSSARLPHCQKECMLSAIHNFFIFSAVDDVS